MLWGDAKVDRASRHCDGITNRGQLLPVRCQTASPPVTGAADGPMRLSGRTPAKPGGRPIDHLVSDTPATRV